MPKEPFTAETVLGRIRPCRPIEGISAVLLPFRDPGQPDYDALAEHIARTAGAGLMPAVNMDTGYVDRLSPGQRAEVLRVAKEALGNRPFAAGVFVQGQEGDLVGLGRMLLAGRPLSRKCLCRTFSDCTTGPRHGLVSGCYPLDPFYKSRGEREHLAAIKARLKEVP